MNVLHTRWRALVLALLLAVSLAVPAAAAEPQAAAADLQTTADTAAAYAAQYGGGKDYWGFSHYRQIRDFYEDPEGEVADWSCREALLTQAMICGIYEAARTGRTLRLSRPVAAIR